MARTRHCRQKHSGMLLTAFAAAGQAQARSPASAQTAAPVQLCVQACRSKRRHVSKHVLFCNLAWSGTRASSLHQFIGLVIWGRGWAAVGDHKQERDVS